MHACERSFCPADSPRSRLVVGWASPVRPTADAAPGGEVICGSSASGRNNHQTTVRNLKKGSWRPSWTLRLRHSRRLKVFSESRLLISSSSVSLSMAEIDDRAPHA
jgi:hypothetical protein